MSQASLCPTLKTCPPSSPVLCSYGQCVASAADCTAANVVTCPAALPFLCPSGSCSTNLANCPSQVACPLALPVKCADGTCRLAQSQCPLPGTLTCPGLVCPDGSCTTNLLLCPSVVTCPPLTVRCLDGTCRLNIPSVPGSMCPSSTASCPVLPGGGSVTCPQFVSGTVCATSIGNCPPGPQCPSSTPVLCLDHTCAASISQCPPVLHNYPIAKVPCSDGTWAAAAIQCPTPTVCPAKQFPYKCWDQSCRASPTDCPVQIAGTCPSTSPYRCTDGSCSSNLCTSMASPGTQCNNPAFPVLCANGACVAQAVCNSTYISGSSTTECCDPANLLLPTSSCLYGFVSCANGLCVSKPAFCAPISCTPDLPYLCPSGLCTFNYSTCNAANGCPFNAPFRCWDGSCAPGFSEYNNNCPLNPLGGNRCNLIQSPGTQGLLCNYGGCAASTSEAHDCSCSILSSSLRMFKIKKKIPP